MVFWSDGPSLELPGQVIRLTLARQRIRGTCMSPARAARILLGESPMPPGPGWTFWTQASRWTLSLIQRGRLLPDLDGWRPELSQSDEIRALHALTESMPRTALLQETPARAVESFVTLAVLELCRELLQRRPFSIRVKSWPAAVSAWAGALARGEARFKASQTERLKLKLQLRAWGRSHGRLCIAIKESDSCFSGEPGLVVGPDDFLPASELSGQLQLELLREAGRVPELEPALLGPRPTTFKLARVEAERLLAGSWGCCAFSPDIEEVSLTMKAIAQSTATTGGLKRPITCSWDITLGNLRLTAEELLALPRATLARIRDRWLRIPDEAIEQAARRITNPPRNIEEALQCDDIVFAGDLSALEGSASSIAEMARLGLGYCIQDRAEELDQVAGVLRSGSPNLVICPQTRANAWLFRMEGSRTLFWPELARLNVAAFTRAVSQTDIVLVCLEDLAGSGGMTGRVHWTSVVVDDERWLEYPDSQAGIVLRGLRARSRLAVVASLPPPLPLWTLMEFLNPGLPGPRARFLTDQKQQLRMQRFASWQHRHDVTEESGSDGAARRRRGDHSKSHNHGHGRAVPTGGAGRLKSSFLACLQGSERRLERGRRLAERGRVLGLIIRPGVMRARVRGSRPVAYQVRLETSAIADPESIIRGPCLVVARLLAGIPDPRFLPEQVSSSCTCPDRSHLCKHAAAAAELAAELFELDPLLLAELGGIDREKLLAGTRFERPKEPLRQMPKLKLKLPIEPRPTLLDGGPPGLPDLSALCPVVEHLARIARELPEEVDPRQAEVLALVIEHPLKTADLARHWGIAAREARTFLERMREQGKLLRTGRGRSTCYLATTGQEADGQRAAEKTPFPSHSNQGHGPCSSN